MPTFFKFYILIAVFLPGACPVATAEPLTLVQNGKSNYQLVLPDKPTAIEQRAAADLTKYVSQAAGASLPIVTEAAAKGSNFIYIGNTKASTAAGVTNGIQNDGFAIVANGNRIFIAGKQGKGTLYGANAFLLRFFGIDYLTATVVTVPKTASVIIPQPFRLVSNPTFITRDNFTDMGFNSKWTNTGNYAGGYKDWHHINHVFANWDSESDWGLFGHTFFQLVPPASYFAQHPEYYSLVNGKRQKQQLNLSEPAVANIVIQNLKKLMDKQPSKTYWMVGQEDMGTFCECDNCTRAYRKYGGQQSGLMIEFINKIARAFPDKQIATFAYKQTEAPPSNIKPDANVIIVSAPIHAHHNVPLNSPENSMYANYIKQWGNMSKNQMIWDYYANFMDILTPYPNIGVIAPNFRFYESVNAKHVFAQRPVFLSGSEMEELKAYLISKMLWNPNLDQDSIVASFTQQYYGAAGKYIVEYLDALSSNLKHTGAVLQTQEDALNYSNSFLSPSLVQQYYAIFNKAADAVKDKPELLDRVNDARLALDYYSVKLLKIKGNSSLSGLSNNARDQLRQRFKNSVKRLKVKFAADASQQPIDKYLDTLIPGSGATPAAWASLALMVGAALTYAAGRRRNRQNAA